jgi:hypothetical protein
VVSAIDLDDEAHARCEKVGDVPPDDGLTSKAHAEPLAAQRFPEPSFRLGGCMPMIPRPIGEFERATV